MLLCVSGAVTTTGNDNPRGYVMLTTVKVSLQGPTGNMSRWNRFQISGESYLKEKGKGLLPSAGTGRSNPLCVSPAVEPLG